MFKSTFVSVDLSAIPDENTSQVFCFSCVIKEDMPRDGEQNDAFWQLRRAHEMLSSMLLGASTLLMITQAYIQTWPASANGHGTNGCRKTEIKISSCIDEARNLWLPERALSWKVDEESWEERRESGWQKEATLQAVPSPFLLTKCSWRWNMFWWKFDW